jgi:hypothetical protein
MTGDTIRFSLFSRFIKTAFQKFDPINCEDSIQLNSVNEAGGTAAPGCVFIMAKIKSSLGRPRLLAQLRQFKKNVTWNIHEVYINDAQNR